MNRKVLVLDCDGVLTDGKIYLSEKGKLFKVFGPDDHDAIEEARKLFDIIVVSADKSGWNITKKRVEHDFQLDCFLVSARDRGIWIRQKYPDSYVIYMGDGYWDHLVRPYVDYMICPNNSCDNTASVSDFQTSRNGGDRAVAEAINHLMRLND